MLAANAHGQRAAVCTGEDRERCRPVDGEPQDQRECRRTGQLADHQHRSVRSDIGGGTALASGPGRPRHPSQYKSLIGVGGRIVKIIIEVLPSRLTTLLLLRWKYL